MISLSNGSYYTDNYLSIMIIENVLRSFVVSLEVIGFGGYRLIKPALLSFKEREKLN